jgi:hypothetical protein
MEAKHISLDIRLLHAPTRANNDIMPMMPTITSIAVSEAHGSQHPATPNQQTPAQQPQRTLVKDKVAVLETNIKRFDQDAAKGAMTYNMSSLDDGDSADGHQKANITFVPTPLAPPLSSDTHEEHNEASSKALS